MRLSIPSTLTTTWHGFNELALFHSKVKDLCFENLIIDFSNTTWFDANMAAPLGCILTRAGDEFNSVIIENLPKKIQTILRKNHFLSNYGYKTLPDNNGTVVPYRRFDLDDRRYFASYIQKYTTGKGIPVMTSALKKRFNESIGEIFANAVTHSETDFGVFSCGQYYPNKKRFDYCFTDAGIGFRGAIHKAFGKWIGSQRAMYFCVIEGNTTKKNEPGGLGLKLLKQFIKLNHGKIVIVSNRAYYEFTHKEEKIQALSFPYPGTFINIEVNTSDTAKYQLTSES